MGGQAVKIENPTGHLETPAAGRLGFARSVIVPSYGQNKPIGRAPDPRNATVVAGQRRTDYESPGKPWYAGSRTHHTAYTGVKLNDRS